MLRELKLYYNTLKHLRLEQLYFRLKYRLFPLRKIVLASSNSLDVSKWQLDSPQVNKQSVWGDGKVSFLNQSAVIVKENDWNSSAFEKLWLYNLHYFDDLNAQGASSRVSQQKAFILKWIGENPPIEGNGWEPYPISLRLVNWVKWCQRNGDYNSVILESIRVQAEVLLKKLEYHILGNHLFANAKALVFVGCFFKNDRSEVFLNKGLELVDREINEQFLPDGGHFELSPMYHCILLWDMLDLYGLINATKNESLARRRSEWQQTISKGLIWLKGMCHPDGNISFFNDSSFGVAPSPLEIYKYSERLGFKEPQLASSSIIYFNSSGYSRLNVGHFTLIFDHAEVGPSYLPGHAHADTLSFELSVGNQRVFVNSGTSVYGNSEERTRQRSTSAHNTVVVNDQSSSEVWGGFRVARRASILSLKQVKKPEQATVVASHDGFSRFTRGFFHTRTCSLNKDKIFLKDELNQEFTSAEAHFHLHPEVLLEIRNDSYALLHLPDGVSLEFHCNAKISVRSSTWHPEFGKSIGNKKLVVPFLSNQLTFNINYGQ